MRTDRRRRRQFDLLGAALLVALTLAVVVMAAAGWGDAEHGMAPADRQVLAGGLVALVVMFILYVGHESRQLARLEDRLEHAALREETLRVRLTELSGLFDTSSELASKLDLGGMLDVAAHRLRSCLEADATAILMLHEGRGCLLPHAVAGGLREESIRPLRPGDGVAGHAFSGPESLVVASEPRLGLLSAELGLDGCVNSALVVPITMRGAAIGVIVVARLVPREAYAPVHAAMVETFAGHCAAAVVKTVQYQRLVGEASGRRQAA